MKTQETTHNSKQNSFRIITSLMLNWLLGTASVCLAQADTWTAKSPIPTARALLSTSAVDGKIYAIGGRQTYGGSASSAVEQYDPVTDTWTTKAPIPTARQWLSTSAVNGKIYAFGGTPRTYDTAFSTVEEYDPATDTWTEKAPMPTARLTHSTSVVDGKIYAIGGFIRATTGGAESRSSAVEAYDPATDTWTEKAPMPTARGFLATSVVNGKIYAIGGATAAGGTYLSTVEEYDPVTDTWTTKAPMPTRRGIASASAVNGIIYVIGGGSSGTVFSTVEAYDPATDTWTTKAPLPTRRSTVLAASTVNGIIYVIGGVSGGVLSTVEAYDPATDTWTTKTPMPRARGFFSTSAVDGKIYAIGGSLGSPWNGISTVEEYDTGLTGSSPDFNGDGIVDSADICIMVDHWHTDYPLCDIAPPPFGDGIVDVQDLILLSEHLFEDVNDPTLIAHWALDEAEGEIAYDSAGLNDAFVIGGALWQPSGGQVDGALEFDGVDDSVIANPVLDPADGPLSVLAWVKGGAPGQAFISQQGGANWLGTEPLEGYLMTRLTSPGRSATPLLSETTITDGQWHRIGFVWDGSNRTLYVDGIPVAQDIQNSLESSSNGLYIGTGNAMAPGTYFSGLIDDVRIYNRVVVP